MPISEDLYVRIALEETDETWELHDGWLRCKPGGTVGHNNLVHDLMYGLIKQVDRDDHQMRLNAGRLALGRCTYLVPDLFVLPEAYFQAAVERYGLEALEVYREPVPLVVEVWEQPREEFGHDGDLKLPVYRQRGDLEIWRLHPYERTLHGWRRQPDGSYDAFSMNRGVVRLHALPGVTIDLDKLFGAAR